MVRQKRRNPPYLVTGGRWYIYRLRRAGCVKLTLESKSKRPCETNIKSINLNLDVSGVEN